MYPRLKMKSKFALVHPRSTGHAFPLGARRRLPSVFLPRVPLGGRGNNCASWWRNPETGQHEPAVFVPEVAKQRDVSLLRYAGPIAFGVLVLVFDWIIRIGNSSSASTKIRQKRRLYPRVIGAWRYLQSDDITAVNWKPLYCSRLGSKNDS